MTYNFLYVSTRNIKEPVSFDSLAPDSILLLIYSTQDQRIKSLQNKAIIIIIMFIRTQSTEHQTQCETKKTNKQRASKNKI